MRIRQVVVTRRLACLSPSRRPPGQERRDRARRGRPGEDHRQLPVRHHHEIVAPEELTDESTEESTEESTGMPTEEPTEEPTDEPCLEILMTKKGGGVPFSRPFLFNVSRS